MKKFLNHHPQTILVALAIVFLAAIIGFYVWGVSTIVTTINMAINYVPPQANSGFDLQGAAKLDLHGLVK